MMKRIFALFTFVGLVACLGAGCTAEVGPGDEEVVSEPDGELTPDEVYEAQSGSTWGNCSGGNRTWTEWQWAEVGDCSGCPDGTPGQYALGRYRECSSCYGCGDWSFWGAGTNCGPYC